MAFTPMRSAARERPAAEGGGERYSVLERLGAGGMGVVYRVLDRVSGEERALKRANADERSRRSAEAFEREYQTLASLDHPRIIRVFDFGVDEVGPYYTMELLGGQDMRKAAPLPFKQACLCLRDVATSLALLHARRMIHRDLSPGNVRMTADGHCKLLDFGAALTAFGSSDQVVGTPPVIAPEVLLGAPLDQRVDLYGLGALAYWMLTGRHAYPARKLDELGPLWEQGVVAPSHDAPDIPAALDALVLSLLHQDPLARPESAAEVIVQLELIGELPAEAAADMQLLAQSFLLRPRFIGRLPELTALDRKLQGALRGSGAAVRLVAGPGNGRSRLLDELNLRAKLAGALVLRADAGMARQLNGVARALTLALFESAPELTRKLAPKHRGALYTLGQDVATRCSLQPLAAAYSEPSKQEHALEQLFVEVSSQRPLIVAVDDIDYADDASVGMLAALADTCAQHAVMIVVSELDRPGKNIGLGLAALRNRSSAIALGAFSQAETHELVHTVFGGAPNAERFSSWLYTRTAGLPLYALELCRRLTDKAIIRYAGGAWTLPSERPDQHLPDALGDAMALRLTSLSEPARGLAECLSLQDSPPSRELCRLLVPEADPGALLELLAELTRHDVLTGAEDGLHFSSNALREALLLGMDDLRRRQNHRRLGEALAALAEPGGLQGRLQAGWHLIQGDDGVRGADMIAEVAADGLGFLKLSVNLHRNAAIVEAALGVYQRQRYSLYRRAPLLATLSASAYYEDRVWGERYGDQALDALEDLTGLRSARRLRPWLGRWLSASVGLALAYLRFVVTPKVERPFSFPRLLVQLCAAVTSLAGVAALALDSARVARVAAVLEPYSVLPERLTFVGVYQFCLSLEQIGLENQPVASAAFERLLARFQDPHYYPAMQGDTRGLYIAPLLYARGAFATFKGDGTQALRCADALDSLGFKMYSMVASQLRFLYYAFRGELSKAAPHRARVEVHAAQVGSAWQVETWECPAMILLYTYTLDSVEVTRLVHRLETLSRSLPALRRYQRLAQHALMIGRGAARHVEKLAPEYATLPARSFIGWAATLGFCARGLNEIGKYEQAKRICEDALAQLSDAHRDYVTLFLSLDLQLALADAGLSQHARALARLDMLLTRFATCDHPLLQGSIHEARASVCWAAGDVAGYQRSLELVEFNFRLTGTPALIAKCEQLAQLARARTRSPAARGAEGTWRTPGVLSKSAANDVRDEAHTATQNTAAPARKR